MNDKILAQIKNKNGKEKTLALSLQNFGTVDLGLLIVPIKELDIWLRVLYGYKLLSIKYKDKIIKF